MSTRLIMVRHGETPASVDRRFAGTTDVELTPNGHRQAEALAQRLRHVRIDAVYVSPLQRCRQTAAPISDTTGLRLREAEELRECDFGEWEGLTAQEVMERHPESFQSWITDDSSTVSGGESWAQVRDRVWEWWLGAAERHKDRTVMAVTHGGPVLCMLRHALGAPYPAMYVLDIDPCSVTMLQYRGELLRVRLVNDTSHFRDVLGGRVAR